MNIKKFVPQWAKNTWKKVNNFLSSIKGASTSNQKGSPGMAQRIQATITIKKIIIGGLVVLLLCYPTYLGIRLVVSNINLSVVKMIGLIFGIMLFLILDLVAVRSATKEGDKKKIVEHWMILRNKIYFMFLWTTIIILSSAILHYLNTKAWWSLYLFREEGNWLFYAVHTFFIVGVWLATTNFGKESEVSVKDKTEKGGNRIKMCGKILVWMALLTWISVYYKNADSPVITAAVKSNEAVVTGVTTPSPSHTELPPETLKKVDILVKAGGPSVGPIDRRDFVNADDVHGKLVRINGRGEFIAWNKGDLQAKEKVKTLEFKALQDYYITVIMPN